MKKIALLITILIVIFVVKFDFINYQINKDISKINNYISQKTNSEFYLKEIDLSFTNINIYDIYIKKNNNVIHIDKLKFTIENYKDIFNTYLNNEININVNSIKTAKINNIEIFIPEYKNSENKKEDNNKINKLKDFTIFIDSINQLEIDNMKINDLIFKNTIFDKKTFQTNYHLDDNLLKIDGYFDIIEYINTNNLNYYLYVKSKKIDLNKIHKYINSSSFQIINGFIDGELNLSYKDNKFTLNGKANVNNTHISIFDKKYEINNFIVNANYIENNINFNFPNKIYIGKTIFDISDISILLNDKLDNIKNIKINSKKLTYEGVFSDNFLKTEDSKIIFNFNLIDLNYFNLLNIFNLPKPLDLVELKEGTSTFFINKANNEKFDINYIIKSKAKLLIDNKLVETNLLIKNEIIYVDNSFIDKIKRKIDFKYNLKTNDYYLNINDNLNTDIFNTVKNIFNLNFDVNLIHYQDFFLNLKLDYINKNNTMKYSGYIVFKNSDLILIGENFKSLNLTGVNGKVFFNENYIKSKNLNIDIFVYKDIIVDKLKIDFVNNNNILNINLINNNIEGSLEYNKQKDILNGKFNRFSYIKEKNENSSEEQSNIEDIKNKIINELKLPQQLILNIKKFTYNNILLGSLILNANKELIKDNYKIIANINNEYYLFNSDIKINEKMDSKIDFNINIKNPEKFSELFNVKQTIKKTNIEIIGHLYTNLNELEKNKIISKTSGNISVLSKDGEFFDVNTGLGFFLNIFSFRTIPNFITMDFANIFQNNLKYDLIQSDLNIEKGIVKIVNAEVKSKIADMNLDGNVNFNDRKVNLKLVITPKITNSVVFTAISILTGFNPLTMFGSTIVDKIIPMPNIIKYNYKIYGTIEEPKIE